jgi:hypothetical protein
VPRFHLNIHDQGGLSRVDATELRLPEEER